MRRTSESGHWVILPSARYLIICEMINLSKWRGRSSPADFALQRNRFESREWQATGKSPRRLVVVRP
jgi:hypothetical protein